MASWGYAAGLFLSVSVGAAIGWHACEKYHGITTTIVEAAKSAQQDVALATEATTRIDKTEQTLTERTSRVEYITRTVTVATECPPGSAPVTEPFDAWVRQLVDERTRKESGAQRPSR